MSDGYFAYWPKSVPRSLLLPQTSLYYNVEVSATRYPNKPYLVYYDTPITFAQFRDETERLAGFLEHDCGVRRGDRVLLYTQNSPQFILAYYAILRANAVVVPVNPMNRASELRHYVVDTGASTLITTQDLFPETATLFGD
ncbi:MAG TPA: AMP-binding protein, partial [Burkholderiales bacterium]|nr:AMP-binding protein [Burkholderiales bacterium]